jgi:predicted Co/Zn/Cd cation transporter (cation efflux family)
LIWLVIFNHKAESPTFIIAIAGVGIWYFSKSNRPIFDTILMLVALFLTSLSVTDLIPSDFRKSYVYPYSIKALGCFVVWVKILWEIVAPKSSKLKG